MKTFHKIVRTIIQQGQSMVFDTEVWSKEVMSDEVAFTLLAHEQYKSYEEYKGDVFGELDFPDEITAINNDF